MELSPQQQEAIGVITKRLTGANPEPLTYLAGFAGTGKSTILPFVLEDLGFAPNDIRFCAPTGKAAKVMRNKLAAQKFPNANATTIHSAIYRARPAPIGQLETELYEANSRRQKLHELSPEEHQHEIELLTRQIKRLEKELDALYIDEKVHFQLNSDSTIRDAKLIVIDEASMVGVTMRDDLMEFGVPILAMGDPGQLKPVGEAPGLTAGEPDYFLTEIHRQAADNPILQLATLARQGKQLPIGSYGDGRAQVMRRRDFNNGHFDWDAPPPQFLVGTNNTRWRVTKMLREGYGIEGKGPKEGEPMIVRKNSREYPNLVNGTQVTSLSNIEFTPGAATFEMSFEDEDGVKYTPRCFQGLFEEHYSCRKGGFSATGSTAFKARKSSVELDFGWALTIHNAQGSQWDHVVLIDESGVFRDEAPNHLYTGITRAAETLTVLV